MKRALMVSQDEKLISDGNALQLIDILQEGLWAIDKGFVTTYVSPRMARIMGYDAKEMLGQHIYSFMDERGRALADASFNAHTIGQKAAIELQLIGKDGKRIHINLDASAIRDRWGNLAGFIASAVDINELKETQRKLLTVAQQLWKSLSDADAGIKAKEDFMSNVNHELRTPLNAIIGFSDVMRAGMAGPMTDEQMEYLNHIVESGRRLLGLVQCTLDMASVESGSMELKLRTVNLKELLQYAVSSMQRPATEGGVDVRLTISPEADIMISVDERKLRQVMHCLLDNAVKFTPRGGSVTVHASLRADFVEIKVDDTGIGIKTEDMPRLFELFTQLEPVRTKKYQGLGLGLYLARKLVELHGGTMRAKSEHGKGSSFTVLLSTNAEKQAV